MKIHKTNAARLLDTAKVAYHLVSYEVDENDLSAAHLAEQLGQDVSRIFKTLVLHGDRSGYFVCVVPGGNEVDLKKAAKASGNKSCAMILMKNLDSNSIGFIWTQYVFVFSVLFKILSETVHQKLLTSTRNRGQFRGR